MADGIVTDGYTGTLANLLSKALGCRVVVHRVETKYKLPGKGGSMKTAIRYSLGIAGCNPPVFFDMTINEVKGRMAMILDLVQSGVLHASPPTNAVPGRADQVSSSHEPARSGDAAQGQDGHDAGSVAGDRQPPSSDDRY